MYEIKGLPCGGYVKVWKNGIKCWRNAGGMRHRLDGPSVIGVRGHMSWYINGRNYMMSEFNKHPLVLQHKRQLIIDKL